MCMWTMCTLSKPLTHFLIATQPTDSNPPNFYINPPFLGKKFIPPPKRLNFWKVLPPSFYKGGGGGGGGSNYVVALNFFIYMKFRFCKL